MFIEIYQSLRQGFQESTFKFLFRNATLTSLLTQDEIPSADLFFGTYLSLWRWNFVWFRSLIQNQDHLLQFDAIVRALQILENLRILTEENCNRVAAHANPIYLASALSSLQQAGIFINQDNFLFVAAHGCPRDLADTLFDLKEAAILNRANFDQVIAHASSRDLAFVLSFLQQAAILNQDNFDRVIAHFSLRDLDFVLSSLKQAAILNQDNFDRVIDHFSLRDLGFDFYYLKQAAILNQDNFDRVITHDTPGNLASALSFLHHASIFNQDNFALVAAHPSLGDLADAFSRLEQASIFNQDNFALVAAQPSLVYLVRALSDLKRARILNQANFTALLAPNHANLVSEEANRLIWGRITSQFLSQANFQRLLTAAEHVNPMEELQRVRDQIIGGPLEAGHAAVFNPRQSTHTSSVHRTVSGSALRLKQSYGAGLNLETKIQEIKGFVNGLSDEPKHQAAKRCIERITEVDYTCTDCSGVSIRQLLALAYTAIHDDSKRFGTLNDALDLFVEGLYEIQRGYSLNEFGENLDGVDSPICASGTFNKLIEKLNGIHQDVAVYYITHECASAKFPRLAIVHANIYLQSAVLAATANDYRRVKELLEGLKTDGSLEPVWENIKAGVQTELWDEFKEAYGHNPRHEKFLSLINNGQYLTLLDVSAFEAALIASPGHQAFLDEQIRLSVKEQSLVRRFAQHSIWVNRDSSADARENFDKQYGLVLMS